MRDATLTKAEQVAKEMKKMSLNFNLNLNFSFAICYIFGRGFADNSLYSVNVLT